MTIMNKNVLTMQLKRIGADMGQQYVETLGVYGKKLYFEYPSELQCYDGEHALADQCRDTIFNQQYGIFYYEPADEIEALQMIAKFKDKIRELEAKYCGDE